MSVDRQYWLAWQAVGADAMTSSHTVVAIAGSMVLDARIVKGSRQGHGLFALPSEV
jgi:hypothetical protein